MTRTRARRLLACLLLVLLPKPTSRRPPGKQPDHLANWIADSFTPSQL